MTDTALQRATPKAQSKPGRKASWQVWRDASGRLSALRIAVLAFLFVPLAIATYDFNFDPVAVGARPLNNVIHRTGYWALILLLVSLAITPLRRIARSRRTGIGGCESGAGIVSPRRTVDRHRLQRDGGQAASGSVSESLRAGRRSTARCTHRW